MAEGYKELRGDSWLLRVYLGRGKDGKPIRKNRTVPPSPNGKPLGVREANQELRKFLDECEGITNVHLSRMKVSEYSEWWLENVQKPNVEGSTYEWQKGIMETKLVPAFGHLKMNKVETKHIQEFYKYQLEQGKIVGGKETGQPLSLSTVRGYRRILNAMFNYLVELKSLKINPVKAARLDPPDKRRYVILDQEGVVAFIKEAKKDRNFALYMTDLLVGLRKSELLALRWKDINLEKGEGEVWQTITKYGRNYEFKDRAKNGQSLRKFPIPDVLCEILKRHKAKQNEERLLAGDAWHKGPEGIPLDLVFCYQDGRPINGKSLLRSRLKDDGAFKLDRSKQGCSYRTILKRAGLPEEMRLHDLRHSFATFLLEGGENLALIGALLGHSDGSMVTELYTHSNMKMKKRAIERLTTNLNIAELVK